MAREGQRTSKKKAKQLTLAVVGAGRLGTALALALAARGYRVRAVVTRRKQHARRAAKFFSAPHPLAFAAAELSELPKTDLLIISTPDDQIAATAARLAALADTRQLAPVALHTSGALNSDALAALRAAGLAVGSLHPLVSISDARAGAADLRGAFYCVEGDRAAVRAARRMVRALAGHSFSIKAEDKALYHAAAVLASGHTVALFDLAAELLARCGVAPTAARRALLPLTHSTLNNLRTARTPAQALTGPFARGDAQTVRRNLAALAADPVALRIYALLGAHALRLARQKGVPVAVIKEIEAVLRQ
ncbi:MAG: Rossmann-like and DUF2520 domain-containing protein [Pyrinomonadaceae bacterium]